MHDFQRIQQRFVEAVTAPEQKDLVDVEPQRLAVYRRLLKNNIVQFVERAFPVLLSLLSKPRKAALLQQFYSQFRGHSPYFHHIAQSFAEFCQKQPELPAFAADLAYYEWLEVAVANAPEKVAERATLWRWNSTLQSIVSFYPLDKISPAFQPQQPLPQAQCFVVYRQPHGAIRFSKLSPLTALWLHQSGWPEEGFSQRQIIQFSQSVLSQQPPSEVAETVQQALMNLAEVKVLIPPFNRSKDPV